MQPNEPESIKADEPIDYVTTAGWLSRPGRADLIDDVADQFERPPTTAWPGGSEHARWPRASRGWR